MKLAIDRRTQAYVRSWLAATVAAFYKRPLSGRGGVFSALG